MRSSKSLYQDVANECSAYTKSCDCKHAMANEAEGEKSCLNCTHFAEDEHCVLDLYDPIANRIR